MFVNDIVNILVIALHVLGWNINVYAYLDRSDVLGAVYYIVCIIMFHTF